MSPEPSPAATGRSASGDVHNESRAGLRLVPFVVSVIVALALVAGVLQIARWFGADLTTEPGMLRRLGQAITGSETPRIETVGLRSSLSAETIETALWLNALHIAAAVPIIGTLARELPALTPARPPHGQATTA